MATDPNTLTLYQGKTFRVSFTLKDSSGNPVSLEGYGATFAILTRAGGTVLFSLTDQTTVDPETNQPFASSDAPVVVEPYATGASPQKQTGVVQVRLGADITNTLTKDSVYDASIYSLTDATEVEPLAAGPLTVIPIGGDTYSSS